MTSTTRKTFIFVVLLVAGKQGPTTPSVQAAVRSHLQTGPRKRGPQLSARTLPSGPDGQRPPLQPAGPPAPGEACPGRALTRRRDWGTSAAPARALTSWSDEWTAETIMGAPPAGWCSQRLTPRKHHPCCRAHSSHGLARRASPPDPAGRGRHQAVSGALRHAGTCGASRHKPPACRAPGPPLGAAAAQKAPASFIFINI